ncbi:MAG: hypothetical protein Q8P46_03885 [Hyphomicrobiales bacterium]|nr:hypothetical protein [Hyphomicrobiales bacterium]
MGFQWRLPVAAPAFYRMEAWLGQVATYIVAAAHAGFLWPPRIFSAPHFAPGELPALLC